jgi:hypothetical protein
VKAGRTFSSNIVFRHSRRTSTEYRTKSHRSQIAGLRVFAGEIEEVSFTRRVGRVSTVVEAGATDVVRNSNKHVLL